MKSIQRWALALCTLALLLGCKPDLDLDTHTFVKYIGGKSPDEGVDIAQPSESTYLVLCTSRTFGHGSPKMTLLRLDGAGNVDSVAAYASTVAYDLEPWADGYVALGGIEEAQVGGPRDFTVTRFSAKGDSIGYQRIALPGSDEYAGQIQKLADGRLWVTGSSHEGGESRSIAFPLNADLSLGQKIIFRLPGQQLAGVASLILDNTLLTAGHILEDGHHDQNVMVFSSPDGPDRMWDVKLPHAREAVAIGKANDSTVWVLVNQYANGSSQMMRCELKVSDLHASYDTLPYTFLASTIGMRARDMYMLSPGAGAVVVGEDAHEDIVFFHLSPAGIVQDLKTIPSSTKLTASKIIPTRDGGFAIVGSRDLGGHRYVLVTKVNANGEL
jgi:hypothetical protein